MRIEFTTTVFGVLRSLKYSILILWLIPVFAYLAWGEKGAMYGLTAYVMLLVWHWCLFWLCQCYEHRLNKKYLYPITNGLNRLNLVFDTEREQLKTEIRVLAKKFNSLKHPWYYRMAGKIFGARIFWQDNIP